MSPFALPVAPKIAKSRWPKHGGDDEPAIRLCEVGWPYPERALMPRQNRPSRALVAFPGQLISPRLGEPRTSAFLNCTAGGRR